MFKNNNNYYERTKEKLKNVEQKIQNGVEQVKTNVRKTTNAVSILRKIIKCYVYFVKNKQLLCPCCKTCCHHGNRHR